MAVRKITSRARRWVRITQLTLGVGMLLWSGDALASQSVINAVTQACAGQQLTVNVNDCALCHGSSFTTINPSNMYFSDAQSGFYDSFCTAVDTGGTTGTGTGTGTGTTAGGTDTGSGTGTGSGSGTTAGTDTDDDTTVGSVFDDDGDGDGGRGRFRRAAFDDDADDGGTSASASADDGGTTASVAGETHSRRDWGRGQRDSRRSDRHRRGDD
jgi:hypothetical protein